MVEVGKTIALLALGGMISLPSQSREQTASPAAGAASPAASSADLQKVISQLDTAAAKFLSAQADFTWDQFQVLFNDHDVQTGTIYFERKKGVTRMAAYFLQENGKDAAKTVSYDGSEVNFYEPRIKQMTILRAGADRNQWESFLTLGFGGSGADLQANWKVSLLGTESLNGVSVAKLDLVPTAQKVQQMFTHVTVWVDPTRAISLKQIFYEPSGDLRTVTYADRGRRLPHQDRTRHHDPGQVVA